MKSSKKRKSEKILLLNPPKNENEDMVREGRCMQRVGAWSSLFPPLTLCMCGTILKELNHEIKVVDCIAEKLKNKDVKKILLSFQPDIVLINTSTPSIDSDLGIAELVKETNKKTITAVFGTHVSNLDLETLKKNKRVDVVIRNEVEDTIKELSLNIKKRNFKNIKGITYRDEKNIKKTPKRDYISNLDRLPYPDWSLVKLNNYTLPRDNVKFLLVTTSRGCVYQCKHCVAGEFYGKKYRKRSVEKMVGEIKNNIQKYNINHFLFWSESFTLDNNYVEKFCKKIIEEKLEIKWICNSRVDNINYELLKLMKKAGCFLIGYGFDSGNQEVLNSMKKGTKLRQAIEAVEMTKKAGIEIVGHFVLGMPTETKETIENTIDFAKKLDIDYAQFYCATPWPGTELYEEAKKNNYIINNDWRYFEQNYSVMDIENLSHQEVQKLRRKAYASFYLRPKIIIKNLTKIKSFSDLRAYMITAKNFLTWM